MAKGFGHHSKRHLRQPQWLAKRGLVFCRLLAMTLIFALLCGHVTAQTTPRKKVAVVLSGGGAKGFAHIGVLKVIEKAGIPVDYVVGTSIGALVGGLYAIGYDATTLDTLVHQQDWRYLLSDQLEMRNLSLKEKKNQATYLLSRPIIRQGGIESNGGLISGHNLSSLFSWLTLGYHDSIRFDNLPIPFACVATNMVDYSEVVMRNGWLSQAMRASMAIPGVFTPVRIDSMVLVDGGLKNNYPVDVARSMGADIVIGVTLLKPARTSSELSSGLDILTQLVDFNVKNKFEANVDNTDIHIAVDVTGYSSTSFNTRAVDTLVARGEQAAMRQWEELAALRDELGIDSVRTTPPHRHAGISKPSKIRLAAVDFDGVSDADKRYITRKYGLSEDDSVTIDRIENAIIALRSDLMYSSAEYNLRLMAGGYWLTVSAGKRATTQLSLGVRFDTEETVALQAYSAFRLPTKKPADISVTGRLGRRYMAKILATVMPLNRSKWFVEYTYRYNDINIYDKGDRDFNITYHYNSVKLGLFSLNIRNFSLDAVARWENFNYGTTLYGKETGSYLFDDKNLISYNLWLHYNSENNRYFTTHGAMLEAGYSLYTDNFVGYNSGKPIHAVSANWRVALRLSNRLTLQPMAYGRILICDELPWAIGNFIGGDFAGHYFEQQLPFAGMGNVEMTRNSFIAAGLKMQQRIVDNNYVAFRMAFALNGDKPRNLLQNPLLHGYQLSWAYDSLFGPAGANVGYCSNTRKVFFYINLGFEF